MIFFAPDICHGSVPLYIYIPFDIRQDPWANRGHTRGYNLDKVGKTATIFLPTFTPSWWPRRFKRRTCESKLSKLKQALTVLTGDQEGLQIVNLVLKNDVRKHEPNT
jgi:hypothetical protein